MSSLVSFQAPRRLRAFSFDPSICNRHANRRIRHITISIPWELDPVVGIGPHGEYLQVVDYDPASGSFYEPINLGTPEVRFTEGMEPSEESPQFHQQMVYAVCMDTIAVFEQVLGRKVLWSPREWDANDQGGFVRQLRIYPHALREANAYYDPNKKALLFGYFTVDSTSRTTPPDTTVFTCLSHDIIVHEVCHAILDGMHPRFVENSNPDMLALHEAFADIVAIFMHFSHPEVLEDQIARTRGDLEKQSLLGALAQEFGQALGYSGALRDALGRHVDGEWQPREPDNQVLSRLEGPHARGSILVAAVFRSFLSIYRSRVADLFRIASNGSGILRDGEIDPDLCKRLADEAAKSARHILRMCIRAMDYVPPADISFGDYLRAIVTADYDLYPEDDHDYRPAVIEAFSAWGIYPEGMPIISQRALLWDRLHDAIADSDSVNPVDKFEVEFGMLVARPDGILDELRNRADMHDGQGYEVIKRLEASKRKIAAHLDESLETSLDSKSTERSRSLNWKSFTKEDVFSLNLLANEFENDRYVNFLARGFYSELFWGIITGPDNRELTRIIGITLDKGAPKSINRSRINKLPAVQIHSVRMASRIGKRGQKESEYVVEIIQSRDGYFDHKLQAAVDRSGRRSRAAVDRWEELNGNRNVKPEFRFRCGSTLLIDSKTYEIRRVIRTPYIADEDEGLDRLRRYLSDKGRHASNAFDDPASGSARANAFAALHGSVRRESF